MLVILRILFGAAFLYEMVQGARSAPNATEAGDMTGAFYMVVCVTLGILNALVWAPYLGGVVSGPLTGMITQSNYVERNDWALRLVRWFEARGYRRVVLALAFFEGVRRPAEPAAFQIGLKNAKRNSWFEKVFAREVFRFSNTQACLQAYLALKRHGIDPRPHHSQEVNIMLLSLERPPRPEAVIVAVPAAPKPAPPKRNPQIRLFRPREDSALAQPLEAVSASSAEGLGPLDSTETPPQETRPTDEPALAAPASWFSTLLARVTAFIRAH
jgi:hypothetical protein